MKQMIKSSRTLATILIALYSLARSADGGVIVNFSDAGSGTSDMTILASGTVTSVNSWFTYETLAPTFHGTAYYENIIITPVSTGVGSAPFNKLRVMPNFETEVGSLFQLYTGGSVVNAPFDLSSMNGTYNVPVDYSLLNEGSWTLVRNSGMDVGEVTLTVGAIPEPATMSLVALFGGGLFLVRRVFQT